MPELPEVETVRKILENDIINKTIVDVKIFWNKIIKEPEINLFRQKIINQKIIALKRKAKHLIFEFENDYLISHLRMEGKYYYGFNQKLNWNHVLLVFDLDNGYQLAYYDTRKFGTFHLQSKNDAYNLNPLKRVGPEPFDSLVTPEYLQNKWKNKKQVIKTALLDQTVMSGLGNIYVNEVLFASKIHPLKVTKNLDYIDLKNIINNSRIILEKSIQMGGTTIASYTSSLGVIGQYQNELLVHTKVGLNCSVCFTKIIKIKVNGRGTYFCNQCQSI